MCAIASCSNPDDVSYFTFPKDDTVKKIWVRKCKRSDNFNPETSRICEKHFTADDFERNLKSELLELPY